jgi:hypothetical protein
VCGKESGGGVGSGSGYLVVVPIDALGDGGHFGGSFVEIGRLLSELWAYTESVKNWRNLF